MASAFRQKQEEMKRLREQGAAGGGGASNTTSSSSSAALSNNTSTTDSQAAPTAADRFRQKKEASGGGNETATNNAAATTGDGSSAASYFLKKKSNADRGSATALSLEADLSPDQYRAMYERAVKDNQLLVKKYNERSTEVKQLKDQLKKAQSTPAPSAAAATTTTANPRASVKVSREQRMSMAMTTQLGSQLGNLLQLVQNLDEQIKSSESARQYAEEKLIEMALQKIDVTEALKKVDEALEKVAQKMKGGGGVDKELVASILTKIRKDILGADVDDKAGGANNSNNNGDNSDSGAPQQGLLAQIRAGVQLSRVDVEKLKAHRNKERVQTARQSVMMMQSLESTLRSALEMRGIEMNPDNADEVASDDWE